MPDSTNGDLKSMIERVLLDHTRTNQTRQLSEVSNDILDLFAQYLESIKLPERREVDIRANRWAKGLYQGYYEGISDSQAIINQHIERLRGKK